MIRVRQKFDVSERRSCLVLHQPRTTQRREVQVPDDEPRLVGRIVDLAGRYGRYGYRRITALLRIEGWTVNHKRVERLWRQEGLKVPVRQPRRSRLWLNDGSCVRLRPLWPKHVWAYDFVQDRTHDGRPLRMLTLVDEYTRECLAIDVARRMRAEDVLERLTELFIRRGVPDHIRSDNGAEFTAQAVRDWLAKVGVKTLFIERGSPWENGYVESFNVSYHLNPATDYHFKPGHFEEAAVRGVGLPAIRLEDLHGESSQDGRTSFNYRVGPVGLVVSSDRRGSWRRSGDRLASRPRGTR